ncbi:BspA family leucine-rich repeat surface protein [Chryseobacterium koreense]|uniref:BspA family leucine-rich repeat surface protein n=1 Tax=Chryseobacterium koreense TaxID=232216 RepID=UPI0026EE8684|nr:BspA family leucine-rich repeat surface protein [Chryseobacterium koreense]
MKRILFFTLLFFCAGIFYAQNEFITVWKPALNWDGTTSNTSSIVIPVTGTSLAISWEEVGYPSHNGTTTSTSIDFGVPLNPGGFAEAIYKVKISGNVQTINFLVNSQSAMKLLDVSQWGTSVWTDLANAFTNCIHLNITATDYPNLVGVSSLKAMFNNTDLSIANIENWQTSTITDMSDMFGKAKNFNSNIGNWDTAQVTNMHSMFNGASKFNQNIGNWNTSNVTSMGLMFKGAFLFNQNLNNWNTSKVTNMFEMFNYAFAFNGNISSWDVSKVTQTNRMFAGAGNFNQNIGNWNTSSLTSMIGMFMDAVSFNANIGSWNVSNVADMSYLFSGASSFNQNIGNWDVSGVNNLLGTFSEAISFNQDIGNWNTQNVMFFAGTFYNASSFNQNISTWNTSAATSMALMFQGATSFNQDLSSWNTSNVSSMERMFEGATSFNQSLANWNLKMLNNGPQNVSLLNLFTNTALSCINYDNTLQGWAQNTETPNFLDLGNVSGIKYSSPQAVTARNFLLMKGWVINGDSYDPSCNPLATNEKVKRDFVAYPNPVSEFLFVKVPITQEFKLFNANGQLIRSSKLVEGENKIDFSKLSKGLYLIHVNGKTEKIIKR